jgi:hypothetical protein
MRLENILPDHFKEKEGTGIIPETTIEQRKQILEKIQNDPAEKKRTQYFMIKINLMHIDEQINQLCFKYKGNVLVSGPLDIIEQQEREAYAKMSKDPEYVSLKAEQDMLYSQLAKI